MVRPSYWFFCEKSVPASRLPCWPTGAPREFPWRTRRRWAACWRPCAKSVPAASLAYWPPGAPSVGRLLDALREAGADQQVIALLARLPAAGMFRLLSEYTGSRFRFGCEPDGRPAGPWGWEDLG